MRAGPAPGRFVVGILVVALVLAGVVSYYAASSPDGLNRVAEDKGFSSTQKDHATSDNPLAGYDTKGIGNDRLSGGWPVWSAFSWSSPSPADSCSSYDVAATRRRRRSG